MHDVRSKSPPWGYASQSNSRGLPDPFPRSGLTLGLDIDRCINLGQSYFRFHRSYWKVNALWENGAVSVQLKFLTHNEGKEGYSSFSMAIIPSLEPDANDCKLHNSYDVQSCILAGVSLVLGAAVCFYGEQRNILIRFAAQSCQTQAMSNRGDVCIILMHLSMSSPRGWGFWHFLKKIIKIPTPGQRIKWFTSHLLFKIDRSNAWCQVKIPTLGICVTVKFPWVARPSGLTLIGAQFSSKNEMCKLELDINCLCQQSFWIFPHY